VAVRSGKRMLVLHLHWPRGRAEHLAGTVWGGVLVLSMVGLSMVSCLLACLAHVPLLNSSWCVPDPPPPYTHTKKTGVFVGLRYNVPALAASADSRRSARWASLTLTSAADAHAHGSCLVEEASGGWGLCCARARRVTLCHSPR
jgi:hypothetical protein